MKTNVKIELTDAERWQLANLIDGKQSARMVSRKDVITLCQAHISGLLNATPATEIEEKRVVLLRQSGCDLYTADPADVPLMAQPNNPGYVRGWNTVKRSKKNAS